MTDLSSKRFFLLPAAALVGIPNNMMVTCNHSKWNHDKHHGDDPEIMTIIVKDKYILYHTLPYYYTLPYSTILYHTLPHSTILYHTLPYSTILYHTIPYYYTLPHSTILYCTLPHY